MLQAVICGPLSHLTSSRTSAIFSRRRDLAWMMEIVRQNSQQLSSRVLHAGSLVPLMKARHFGMTQIGI